MRILVALLCFGTAVDIANAAPVRFKCQAEDGTPVADLVVDVDKRVMAWGEISKYTIHMVDDVYISAYETVRDDSVGGEVFVFNRNTGEYARATVFLGFSSPDAVRKSIETGARGRLVATTYAGRCAKPLL